MTEEQEKPTNEKQSSQEKEAHGEEKSPPEAPASSVPAAEIEEGKMFAVLSYALSFVGLPFFIVPLIMRNNALALYHAKQCLLLWLAGVAVGVVSVPLTLVCIGVVLGPAAGIFILVLCIMGLINAAKGVMEPVPLIGKWAEDWFKGINKV
ncbi:MAG: DUF4870 domain-containing protein [Kiritimatiellia bacterium]